MVVVERYRKETYVYIYRVYTKEWCCFPLFTIESALFFCVYLYIYTGIHKRMVLFPFIHH